MKTEEEKIEYQKTLAEAQQALQTLPGFDPERMPYGQFVRAVKALIPNWLVGLTYYEQGKGWILKATLSCNEFDAIWGFKYRLEPRYIEEDFDLFVIDVADHINQAYQKDMELRRNGIINEYTNETSTLWNVGE